MAIVGVSNIERAISDALEDFADYTFKATDKALDVGAKILIQDLKSASPVGATKEFAKSWKKKKKYKLKRYIGNTKMVKGAKSEIPLANILEYSTVHGQPFIKRTYNNSIDKIAMAIIDEVRKGI